MNYIVTGGAGFIGSKLANKLVELGHDVTVIDDLRFGDASLLDKKINFCQVSIENRYECINSMHKSDGLFHLAAFSRSGPSIDKAYETFSSNVMGMINVLDGCLKYNIKRVIFAGSATYYGNGGSKNKVTDLPDFLNMYGLSKGIGELLLKQYNRNFGLDYLILRYFNVYGPGQPTEGEYALVIGIFLQRFRDNLPLIIHGSGIQRRDFIHVADVVDATIKAMMSGRSQKVYNVGFGQNISISELASIISHNQKFEKRRDGDAEEILADIEDTVFDLNWKPKINIIDGINQLKNQ